MQNAPLAVATPCPPSISFPTSSLQSDFSTTPSLFVTLSHKHVTSHLHTRIFSRGILSEIRHFCHLTRALSAAGAAGRRAHVAFHPPRAALSRCGMAAVAAGKIHNTLHSNLIYASRHQRTLSHAPQCGCASRGHAFKRFLCNFLIKNQ
jgi:hypothetical protein